MPPHEPRIEVFRRGDDGIWSLYEAGATAHVKLTSIACALSVDEVYADPLA